MKLIGAEIRVGYANGPGLQEAKLIPLEVVYPLLDPRQYNHAVAQVTFHTSNGDVTVTANLPDERLREDTKFARDADEATAWIRRQLERLEPPA